MVSSLPSRSIVTLLAVTALAAAGCGAASTPRSGGDAPQGRLTAAEFRALRNAIVTEKHIFHGHRPLALKASGGAAVCAPLFDTETALMVAEGSDCGHLVAFLQEVVRSAGEIRACAPDPGCAAGVFGSGARSARGLEGAARAVVREVQRRGFRGRCAQLLGHSRSELGAFHRLPAAYARAHAALAAGDLVGYRVAARALTRIFAGLDEGPDTDASELGRVCQHE